MSRSWKKFKQGQADYRRFKPRPPTPSDEDAYKSSANRWYGWMIERSKDITKIIQDLDRAGVGHTVEGDRAFDKRVRALDAAHELYGRPGFRLIK